jgi:hypothetical protein
MAMKNIGTVAQVGWDRIEALKAEGYQVEIRLAPEYEVETDLWLVSDDGAEAQAMMVAAGLITQAKADARREAARARLGLEG